MPLSDLKGTLGPGGWTPPPIVSGGASLASAAIRASIASAATRNPVIEDPWTTPPPWTPSTAYYRGQCVTGIGAGNTNNLYHCSVAGTSAASGGPINRILADQDDGGAKWMYAGPKRQGVSSYPFYSSVTPAVPTDEMTGFFATITDAVRTTLGLTRLYQNTFAAKPVRVTGGELYDYFGFIGVYGSPGTANPDVRDSAGASWCMHFRTNAKRYIALQQNGGFVPNRNFYIEVNGRPIIEYAAVYNNSAGNLLLDLSFFGPGPKDIKIYSGFFFEQSFATIAVENDAMIWPGQPRNGLTLCVEGTSIEQGGGSDTRPNGDELANLLARLLGIDDWYNNAVGASGCISTNGGTRTNYGQRLKHVVNRNPDIFVIGGFHNDNQFLRSERRAKFLEYLQQVRAALPNCTIVVTGNSILMDEPLTTVLEDTQYQCEVDGKFAFDQFADANSVFIPLLTAAQPFPVSTSNNTWFFSSPQGGNNNGHPTFRYYRSVAQRIADGIRQFYA